MLSIELSTETWIAIVTLLVACISLFVAVLTLKSQKKTQQNTAPIVTQDVQYTLLKHLFHRITYIYYALFALYFELEETDYKTNVSHHFWDICRISSDYYKESLFYQNEEKYFSLKHLSTTVQSFSNDIERLQQTLQSNNNANLIRHEFKQLFYYHWSICNAYYDTLLVCFERGELVAKDFFYGFLPIDRWRPYTKNDERKEDWWGFDVIEHINTGDKKVDCFYRESIRDIANYINGTLVYGDITEFVQKYVSFTNGISSIDEIENAIINQIAYIVYFTIYRDESFHKFLEIQRECHRGENVKDAPQTLTKIHVSGRNEDRGLIRSIIQLINKENEYRCLYYLFDKKES